MRPGSDTLKEALKSSVRVEYTADLWYDGQRVLEDLRVVTPSLQSDSTAKIETAGRVTVVWSDPDGGSIAPELAGDWLAPFGSRVVLFCTVSAGEFSERVQLGEFNITQVPHVDGHFVVGDLRVMPGQLVTLELHDRMVEVERDIIIGLQSPTSRDSVWAEIGRLTGFQLTRTLPDAPFTARVYPSDRVEAVQDLAAVLGGVAFMEWDGTLSMRPVEPGPPVASLELGPDGTITGIGASLSSTDVFNGVVILSQTGDQQAILAQKWVETGPLRATMPGEPRTPFHRKPKVITDPNIETRAAAEAAVETLLPQVSVPRAAQIDVTCVFNPLLQVGDVVTVTDHKWVWTIRLTRVPLEQAAVMTVTGDVIDRVLR